MAVASLVMPLAAMANGSVSPRGGAMPAAYYGMAEAKRSDALLRSTVLAVHNGEREALGLPDLAWDDALANDAGRYAAEMAKTGVFQHSPRTTRGIPTGENLWMGSRRLYDYRVMLSGFVDEKQNFRANARFPDVSRTGRWQDVGHYTQMIWRGTTKVGCALGDGAGYEYLVCRYFPAGNIFGRGPLDRDGDSAVSAKGGH